MKQRGLESGVPLRCAVAALLLYLLAGPSVAGEEEQAGAARGPWVRYTFDSVEDGRVRDASGHGRDALVVGAPVLVDSPRGRALVLGSRETYAMREERGLRMADWDGLTVALRVKLARHTTYDSLVCWANRRGEACRGFNLEGGFRDPGFLVSWGDARAPVPLRARLSRGERLPLGRWVHVVGVLEDGRARLFLDGEPVAEAAAQESGGRMVEVEADTLLIGRAGGHRWTWFDAWLDGQVDEFALWDRALSDAEIARLAAGE